MNKEINRQILEQDKKHDLNLIAAVLWSYRQETGSGKIKIKRFYKRFISEYERFIELFGQDESYPERKELEKIGVFIEELQNDTTD